MLPAWIDLFYDDMFFTFIGFVDKRRTHHAIHTHGWMAPGIIRNTGTHAVDRSHLFRWDVRARQSPGVWPESMNCKQAVRSIYNDVSD